MSVKIKICDINDIKTVDICLENNVDYIGLHAIYYDKLTAEKLDFFEQVKKRVIGKIKLVLVTREEDLNKICEMCLKTNLDYVQLHFINKIPDIIKLSKSLINSNCNTKIIPVFKYEDIDDEKIDSLQKLVDYILFDTSYYGGTGKMTNQDNYLKISKYSKKINYFVAGGLNSDNIQEVVKLANPFGVDVQTGVEENKVKDARLIRKFVSLANQKYAK